MWGKGAGGAVNRQSETGRAANGFGCGGWLWEPPRRSIRFWQIRLDRPACRVGRCCGFAELRSGGKFSRC